MVSPNRRRRQKKDREATPIRRAYAKKFPHCQNPRCDFLGMEVHEIFGGTKWRSETFDKRPFLLHLCLKCHRLSHALGDYRYQTNLTWKKLSDPEGFDLDAVNQLLSDTYRRPVTRFVMRGRWVRDLALEVT